jgi:hypothetical protein
MDYFYNEGLKKAVQIFGSRFNDMQVKRESSDGVEFEMIDVPISYSPIQKELARIQADLEGKKNVNIILPRMSFEILGIAKNTQRIINKRNRICDGSRYAPVPYDINFELNVIAKNMEDALKIVEQIFPFFNPSLGLSAKLLDDSDEIFEVPLVLNSSQMIDTYEGDFLTRRAIMWKLDFTLNYMFFGPPITQGVIKFVKVNTYNSSDMSEVDIEYTAQPGLTANNEPTTDVNESVAYSEIDADDDYGFIFNINEDPD